MSRTCAQESGDTWLMDVCESRPFFFARQQWSLRFEPNDDPAGGFSFALNRLSDPTRGGERTPRQPLHIKTEVSLVHEDEPDLTRRRAFVFGPRVGGESQGHPHFASAAVVDRYVVCRHEMGSGNATERERREVTTGPHLNLRAILAEHSLQGKEAIIRI